MTTHTSAAAGLSQCDRILRLLECRRGEWIAMPELVAASGSYNVHSRISDLRRRGHDIEQKNERHAQSIHSYYRLL